MWRGKRGIVLAKGRSGLLLVGFEEENVERWVSALRCELESRDDLTPAPFEQDIAHANPHLKRS